MPFLDFLKKLFKVEGTPRKIIEPVKSDVPFKLVDVEKRPAHKSRGGKGGQASSTSLKDLDVDTVLAWSKRYDEEHPWWVQEEARLGEVLRR